MDKCSKIKILLFWQKNMEKFRNTLNADEANRNIKSMLEDYMNTRKSQCDINFITPSLFEGITKGEHHV